MIETSVRYQSFIHDVRLAIEKTIMKQMLDMGFQADLRLYVLTPQNVKQICNAIRSKYIMSNEDTWRDAAKMICSLLCQYWAAGRAK